MTVLRGAHVSLKDFSVLLCRLDTAMRAASCSTGCSLTKHHGQKAVGSCKALLTGWGHSLSSTL